MKAVAKLRPGPGLEMTEAEERDPRPGEVKLKVERASICGTDLHIFQWDPWAASRIVPPRVIGHEICGRITQIGAGVTGREIGQLVCTESHIVDPEDPDLQQGLGHVARSTRILGVDVDGGFAESLVIPATNARPVPPGVPPEIASMMDALGNAVHTVMAGPVGGLTVLITGLGPIGLFAMKVCEALGASCIIGTEVSPYRRALAERMGASAVIDPSSTDALCAVLKVAPGGVDAVLEMSGHPSALELAISAVNPGGRISLLGVSSQNRVEVETNEIVFKGVTVQGIVGRRLWETWEQMEHLFTHLNLDVSSIVTHSMPFTEFNEAMSVLASGEAGKIVLEF
ncbi:MAG: zinc-binding dehydrogenase [Fimbriimonadaceae bacterium]|nr:zinc-binding dehydrogenase [Fimbriimonadaceae bacterium]